MTRKKQPEIRVFAYKRHVLARRGSERSVKVIAEWYASRNPDWEVAVEFTNSANARERWRTIRIVPLEQGLPDEHPQAEEIRKGVVSFVQYDDEDGLAF